MNKQKETKQTRRYKEQTVTKEEDSEGMGTKGEGD